MHDWQRVHSILGLPMSADMVFQGTAAQRRLAELITDIPLRHIKTHLFAANVILTAEIAVPNLAVEHLIRSVSTWQTADPSASIGMTHSRGCRAFH